MSIKSMLNLRDAVVIRKITESSDGFGASSTSTTLTTISYASIWQPSSSDITISDKITKVSTHVLAMRPSEYSFSDDDKEAIYDGDTYKIVGHADDVTNRGRLLIVGLERLS